jgi:hypothetical protein
MTRGRTPRFSESQRLAIAAAVEFHHRNRAPLRGVEPSNGRSGNFNRTLRMGAWHIVAEKLGGALGFEAVKKIHEKHKGTVRSLSISKLHAAMRDLPTPRRLARNRG